MAKLKEIQQGMAETILGGPAPDFLRTEICADTIGALERLAVHKNTFSESLISALEGVFPLVGVFVGEQFLRQSLRGFVAKHPPTQPMLYLYGADFPAFLGELEALQDVAYVADIAALEWCTHELMHCEEVPQATGEMLLDAGFSWNPNARFLPSRYPLYDLWRAATGQFEAENIDFDGVGQSVLVLLHEGQVYYQPVEDEGLSKLLLAFENGAEPDKADDALVPELLERGALWPIEN